MRSHRSDEWPCSKGAALALTVAAALGLAACNGQPKRGTVLDEAMRAKRTAASFPAADEDYFHDMDGALPLTKEQIEGRNMWLVWTGGNDRLWDVLSRESLGSLDFLKTISSHPTLSYSRDNRWNYLGLVNEPCFKKATGPDPSHFGLWLDVRDPACGPDPFADADKYKGVQVVRAGRPFRSARITASPPASLAFVCSRIRILTRARARTGIRRSITATPPTTTREIW